MIVPDHTSIPNLISALYPGGLRGFSAEGGRFARVRETVLLYHPRLPEDIRRDLQRLSRAGMPVKLLRHRNFEGLDFHEAAATMWRRLSPQLHERGLDDILVNAHECTILVSVPYIRNAAERAEQIGRTLQSCSGVVRYHILIGDQITAWERPITLVQSSAVGKRAVTHDDIINLRILLETRGNDIDSIIEAM